MGWDVLRFFTEVPDFGFLGEPTPWVLLSIPAIGLVALVFFAVSAWLEGGNEARK